ncbi:MAG: class I SAM-dependent methyltransferase [Nitrospirota bacterium]
MFRALTYTLIAPVYDALIASIGSERKRALNLIRFKEGEKLLIAGIGTGADLPYLPHNIEIEGIDASPSVLNKASLKAKMLGMEHVRLQVMDAERLGYPDEYFDKALLFLILSVVDNPRQAFSETLRVLRPGGELLVFDKFLQQGKRPGILRTGANFVVSRFGTDINRVFEEIVEGHPITMEESIPSLLNGFFMIYRCRKISEGAYEKTANL